MQAVNTETVDSIFLFYSCDIPFINEIVETYQDKLLWFKDAYPLHLQISSESLLTDAVTNFYPDAVKIIKGFKWNFEDPFAY